MHRFFTLDVFTKTPLSGNQLAVVLDADDIDESAMQAIAREFNLPETLFLLAPQQANHNARARIFTPMRELPFAGHPTIGAAVLLASLKFDDGDGEDGDGEDGDGEDGDGEDGGEHDVMVVIEEKIGLVRALVQLKPGAAPFAVFDVPKLPEEVGQAPSVEDLAHGIGLMVSDVGFDHHKPVRASAGVPFVFVPVRNREALARCQSNRIFCETIFGEDDLGVYVYCRDAQEEGHAFRARMFAPGGGIDEDPATGSAVAAFACVVSRFESLGDGDHTLVIEQGFEMGRPSLISLEIELARSKLVNVRIGGNAVIVQEGKIRL